VENSSEKSALRCLVLRFSRPLMDPHLSGWIQVRIPQRCRNISRLGHLKLAKISVSRKKIYGSVATP
jgi:hypothetical protein